MTTCLREAESQKAELTKDLEDQKRKLEQEVSKNEAALNSSKTDQNQSSLNQVSLSNGSYQAISGNIFIKVKSGHI